MLRVFALMIIAVLMGCATENIKITEETAVYKKEWVKKEGEQPTQEESFSRKWKWGPAL